MKNSNVKVSVVLNTCNRGAYIGDTLEGLKRQSYTNFEVIVVNGPSIDQTEEVVSKYNVRYYTAPFNISVSRNIGIKHASGEIIAFIDDDAVPEPDWLRDLVAAYDDSTVAAAGGRVYNADGSDFQYSYGAIDLWGYPVSRHTKRYEYNDPEGEWFNINIGTNASYRRVPLIEVGGFDEEIEYYHDESDVCVRLIQAGYKVAQLDNAYVHHKMAPSFRRKNSRKTVVWDAIVKNTIYYGLKFTEGRKPMAARLFLPFWREKKKLLAPLYLLKMGDFTFRESVVRFFSLIRAFGRGYKRGLFSKRKLITEYEFDENGFKPYITEKDMSEKKMNIVLVNQGFPPHQTDGNARHNGALAKELAARGHSVFVVARAEDGDAPTILFEDGVWVYRHQPSRYEIPTTGYSRTDKQLAHARSVLDTVRSIAEKNSIEFIVVPLWDVEGLSILKHKVAPTILTLMTPLKKVVATQWFNSSDASYELTYEFEKFCIENADAIMPISHNIQETIGELYGVNWSQLAGKTPIETIPLGVDPQFVISESEFEKWASATTKNEKVDILYVGRAERRKGTDILLGALPKLLKENRNVQVTLIGSKDGVDENGKSYYADFKKKYGRESWYKRFRVVGYVSEAELALAYKNCDIFVAPSRYESFGQIYIEAMASGKPVIGTKAGGIPEVVANGKNGFLIANEDAEDLRVVLQRLVSDPKLRVEMGKMSLKIMNEKFTSPVWVDRVINLFGKI